MKPSTKKLFDQVDGAHDWIEGQVSSSGGTRLHSTDVCAVCSLKRTYFSDHQNGVEAEYRFVDGETGRDLSLRQAAVRRCEESFRSRISRIRMGLR